jgi:hypothetical protein
MVLESVARTKKWRLRGDAWKEEDEEAPVPEEEAEAVVVVITGCLEEGRA